MIRKLLTSALFAGFSAGLVAAALQQVFVIPVLLQAELYETGELVHFGSGATDGALTHDHDSHDHAPGEGGDRALWTWLATTGVFIGFAMVLVAAMAFAERRGCVISARTGLLWGAAGFLAVQLLPAIGHPPELPGNAAADLFGRQLWWGLAVLASAAGLACIAFGRGWPIWVAGIALLLVPHIIGAPHPDGGLTGVAPPEIAALFVGRTLGAGFAAWVCLGALVGHFWASDDGLWTDGD